MVGNLNHIVKYLRLTTLLQLYSLIYSLLFFRGQSESSDHYSKNKREKAYANNTMSTWRMAGLK